MCFVVMEKGFWECGGGGKKVLVASGSTTSIFLQPAKQGLLISQVRSSS